jgi:transposase
MLFADKGYDANAPRAPVGERGAWANIPPKSNRKDPICFSRRLHRDRNRIQHFFDKINSSAASPHATASSPKIA